MSIWAHTAAMDTARHFEAHVAQLLRTETASMDAGEEVAAAAYGQFAHDLETIVAQFKAAAERIPQGDYDANEQAMRDLHAHKVRAA